MATEQTAQTARTEAGAVAGTVREETKNVAQQAQQQATSTLNRVNDDMRARANEEASKFAQTLHDTGRQLQAMAGAANEQGIASTVAREGANAAERLASRLDDGGVDAVMADIRSWARRRPGSFLLGAAVTGFVAGRLVRHLTDDQGNSTPEQGNGFRAMQAGSEPASFEPPRENAAFRSLEDAP
jgi:hypothetical protein